MNDEIYLEGKRKMNDQPTPETDAELYPLNGVDIVWPEFARKLERERDEAKAFAGELADIASKYLSFLLAVTPTKTNETHEKETMKVIEAIKRWKKL